MELPSNSKGSDTIRRNGFAVVAVALLEEIFHCGGWALRFPMPNILPSVRDYFLPPSDQDVVGQYSICSQVTMLPAMMNID